MTIFVNLGKLFLVKAIQEAIEHSVNADSLSMNVVLRLFHCPRDLELAKAKQHQLGELISELDKFQSNGNDEIALYQFQTLLTKYKIRLACLAQEKQLSEGATGNALLLALELIQSIYTRIQELQLLNIPKIDDALCFFQYYAAKYFAIKIFINQRLNIVQSTAELPYISAFRERAQGRAILITQSLTQCMKDLDTLNKEHPTYKIAVIRQVTQNIEALLRNESSLHDRYGTALDTTISVFNYINVTRQDNDLLTQCMDDAFKEIRRLSQPKSALALTNWSHEWDEHLFLEEKLEHIEAEKKLKISQFQATENVYRIALEREEAAAAKILLDAFKNENVIHLQDADEEVMCAEEQEEGDSYEEGEAYDEEEYEGGELTP